MKKKRVVYIISKIKKAGLEFQWVAKKMDREKIDLIFITLNPPGSSFNEDISREVPIYHIKYHNSANLFSAFFRLMVVLRKIKPDVVHTHMLDASLIGLFASWILSIKQRVYTRHHSSLNHIYFPSRKVYDRWCNNLATDIVSISPCVTDILTIWEGVKREKVSYIPHGIDHKYFNSLSQNEIVNYKKKLDITERKPVIGIISRFTEWKGVKYVIEAFKKLLKENPEALLISAGGKGGDIRDEIMTLFKPLPSDSYKIIDFEMDARKLYSVFDVFVHVPINHHSEAFGQIYIEALSLGVPSVFTKSGIGNEIAKHQRNCYVANYEDAQSIYEGLTFMLNNPNLSAIIENGKKDSQEYNVDRKISQLEKLYLNGS